jgi:antitoxin (DNA-binding transcriptional repressor) of toxin-antitoxin stability system
VADNVITERDRTMPRSAKMPSITLSQLRDTKRLLARLRAGKTIELRDHKREVAHIVPVKEDDGPKAQDSSGGNRKRKLMRDIGKILRRVDRLPVLDDRSPDEIIGYELMCLRNGEPVPIGIVAPFDFL